ncbi:extracellular solute-binding protein [Microlunatus speluncae]|uniref:extracellular solute-binding protein n=1 Tax=Microlunatus speluncae TaxID=2594267 RepID=UPI0012661FEA|nr:extracellular solute-binding protein [Microlunatus speluncae]
MQRSHDSVLSRRSLIGGGLAVGAVGLAATACSNEGRGGAPQPDAGGDGKTSLPTHVRYEGVKPDLSGAEQGIDDGFLSYPEGPIQAVTEPPGDGQPITVMTGTTQPIPPGLNNNVFWQRLNEAVGSPIEISLTPVEDYGDKFATVVAGNRLPDIFQVASVAQRAQLLAATAVELTPLLAGDKIKKYPHLANIQTASWRAGLVGGQLYGIPIPRGPISTQVLYSRADILEPMGLTGDPRSLDDFVELCGQLTDPRRNRWALTVAPTVYVRQMFGVPNAWSLDGDNLVSANEHPGHEPALEAVRKLWQAKHINPDGFGGQNTDHKIRFGNGTCPLAVDTFSGWPGLVEALPGGRGTFRILPVPLHDGSGPGRAWMGGPTLHTVSINKNSESRIETILSYLDYLAAPFGTKEHLFVKYGLEGVHHQRQNGNPVLTDKGKSETRLELGYQAAAPYALFVPTQEGGTQAMYDAQSKIIPTAQTNPVAGLYSETDSRKGAQINKGVNDIVEEIIQGRRPVSAWSEEVKKWKSGGGDQIRDELAEARQAAG